MSAHVLAIAAIAFLAGVVVGVAVLTAAARRHARRGLLEFDTPRARKAVSKPW